MYSYQTTLLPSRKIKRMPNNWFGEGNSIRDCYATEANATIQIASEKRKLKEILQSDTLKIDSIMRIRKSTKIPEILSLASVFKCLQQIIPAF